MSKKSFQMWVRKVENLPDLGDSNILKPGDFVFVKEVGYFSQDRKTLGKIFEKTEGFSVIKMVRISKLWENYSVEKLENPSLSWVTEIQEIDGVSKASGYILQKLSKKELDGCLLP